MKGAWLLLALGACGGPFSGARLEPLAESQRRALVTISVPSLDRGDTVMRSWPGADPERWPLRELLFALHGVSGEPARAVAGDRPVGISVARDGEAVVDALAFSLRPEVPAREWLEGLGEVRARSGPFALVARAEPPRPLYGQVPQSLYFHVEEGTLLVSGTLRGLLAAGPAAKAAREKPGADVSIDAHPRAWPRAGLTAFLGFLRGQTWPAAGGDLDAALGAESATATLKITAAGAELHWQASGLGQVQPPPLLDPAIAGEGAAALGALDCHGHAVARVAPLVGTCSVTVHTTNEVWSQETSYPLRAGASPGELRESLAAAIRAGTVPGPHDDGDPPVEKRLFSSDRALGVDRVLGALASPEARHAAAVHGGPALRDRFVVRDGRLLVASGPHADERLDPRPGPLPPELQQALATGRGRAGFLFLDLTALWKPWLKAAQVIQSPLADLAARHPALVKDRRPLVITLEPDGAIVTLPPPTFSFLLATASVLFAE